MDVILSKESSRHRFFRLPAVAFARCARAAIKASFQLRRLAFRGISLVGDRGVGGAHQLLY
jgi:hypothetical protein